MRVRRKLMLGLVTSALVLGSASSALATPDPAYTRMRSADQEPINVGDGKPALFPFGFGLRY